MNKIKLLKNFVKLQGFTNVKYHYFIGVNKETFKFYTCCPTDQQIIDINWYMNNTNTSGYAKRVITDKHPKGFLEILIIGG